MDGKKFINNGRLRPIYHSRHYLSDSISRDMRIGKNSLFDHLLSYLFTSYDDFVSTFLHCKIQKGKRGIDSKKQGRSRSIKIRIEYIGLFVSYVHTKLNLYGFNSVV